MNDIEYQSQYIAGNFGGINNTMMSTPINANSPNIPFIMSENDDETGNYPITSITNKYEPMFSPFFGNLSENNFYIFISALAFLLCTNISMPIFKFLIIAIVALLIDNNYGVSIAIILYAICSLDKINNLFVILLIVGALLHIFIPYHNSSFNFNYIIQTILGILMLLCIYYEKQTVEANAIIITKSKELVTDYGFIAAGNKSSNGFNSILQSRYDE
jgi:hypothetical protein